MANLPVKFLLCSLVIAILQLRGTHAVLYEVTNKAASTKGGARFTKEIGITYSKQALKSATATIWNLLKLTKPADRKNVQKVSLFIVTMDGISSTSNNEIHVNADYIGNYSGDVKKEITGVLIHEMTHVWQWNGNDQAPGGLIEGIADFVRLRAGYAPAHWGQPGDGDWWDQGYDVSAWFLDYCDSLRGGFVAQLNRMMRSGYSSDYFVQLLGKKVEQLWSDYKAKYNNGH